MQQAALGVQGQGFDDTFRDIQIREARRLRVGPARTGEVVLLIGDDNITDHDVCIDGWTLGAKRHRAPAR